MKEPVLVILAAGMGSRYGGLKQIDTVVIVKCLDIQSKHGADLAYG